MSECLQGSSILGIVLESELVDMKTIKKRSISGFVGLRTLLVYVELTVFDEEPNHRCNKASQ